MKYVNNRDEHNDDNEHHEMERKGGEYIVWLGENQTFSVYIFQTPEINLFKPKR